MNRINCLFPILLAAAAAALPAQVPPDSVKPAAAYVLGPEDQLVIRVVDIEEVTDKPFRIDMRGNINLPVVGRLHAGGLTVEELETDLSTRFEAVLQHPTVTVFVSEFRSQPVSVLGAVRTPGVHQIRGSKSLFEVLSLAGGLSPDAGSAIKITRLKSAGPLPLPGATDDSSGDYEVAQVAVKSVMDAKNPKDNIQVLPDDVVTVPKADLVYVIGAVHRSGGFVLSEKEKISVLQALSLAEGLDRTAAPKDAKIMRSVAESDTRQEIQVNLKEILAGKSGDVSLRANDILFVPTSGAKSALARGVEVAIQMGTGLAIYRR
jgi:polysaccharide export outer membrane protein